MSGDATSGYSHSRKKGLMRMLLPEYDRACARVVPGSQCGFTAGKNAPAQTLTARLHAEECMIERKMCVRGYIDLGTYFMSVVHEVQWKVEEWAGVPPDVTTVMRALREGLGEELPSLQGRYETGYGLSDRFPICLLYTSPSPRDVEESRMPSSA